MANGIILMNARVSFKKSRVRFYDEYENRIDVSFESRVQI